MHEKQAISTCTVRIRSSRYIVEERHEDDAVFRSDNLKDAKDTIINTGDASAIESSFNAFSCHLEKNISH